MKRTAIVAALAAALTGFTAYTAVAAEQGAPAQKTQRETIYGYQMMTDAERTARNLPTRAEEFAAPAGLSRAGKLAHATIMEALRPAMEAPGGLTSGGCRVFHAPKDWTVRRQERYGAQSALIVVYDGGAHRDSFTYGDNPAAQDAMRAALKAAGFYFEECTGWYGAVYEL